VPRGDGTGPASRSPINVRTVGYSARRRGPGYVNLVPRRGFWGWARGQGGGRGKGRGGGQGMGRGRGPGRGMGRGRGMMSSPGTFSLPHVDNEEVSASTTLPPLAAQRGNNQQLGILGTQAQATEQELRTVSDKVPQTGERGRLRSWVATVDTARCTGCGACVAVCPMEAIAVEVVASVETSNCAGCGVCVDACPQEAITLKIE